MDEPIYAVRSGRVSTGNGGSGAPHLTGTSGTILYYTSTASNSGVTSPTTDTDPTQDIYRRVVGDDTSVLVSVNSAGALEVHDLKTRAAARATFIEFHLVVDAAMSVGDAHVICDRIEEALRAELPSVRVVIHVEPEGEAKLPKGTTAVPFA